MEKQDHLNKQTREFLETCTSKADDARRIRYILEDKFIEHNAVVNALDYIDFLVNSPTVVRPQGALFIARSQNGKSTLVERARAIYEARKDERERITRKILAIEMPTDPTYVSLINTILAEMKLPEHYSKRSDILLKHLVHHLHDYQVKAILIDEFNKMGRAQDRQLRLLLDMIKSISNMAKIHVIAFGIAEAAVILEKDEQMHSRFNRIDIPDWTGSEELQSLLKSFEESLPLRKRSNLTDNDLGFNIFDKTNGTIGELNRLLQACAIKAIESGEEKITVDLVRNTDLPSTKPKGV